MTWCRPPVPVPLLELPRVESIITFWDAVSIRLNDCRVVHLKFDYSRALDEALPEAQQRVLVVQWGMLLVWPDVPFSVSLRRLLMDAKACRSPWGDPPTVIP